MSKLKRVLLRTARWPLLDCQAFLLQWTYRMSASFVRQSMHQSTCYFRHHPAPTSHHTSHSYIMIVLLFFFSLSSAGGTLEALLDVIRGNNALAGINAVTVSICVKHCLQILYVYNIILLFFFFLFLAPSSTLLLWDLYPPHIIVQVLTEVVRKGKQPVATLVGKFRFLNEVIKVRVQ